MTIHMCFLNLAFVWYFSETGNLTKRQDYVSMVNVTVLGLNWASVQKLQVLNLSFFLVWLHVNNIKLYSAVSFVQVFYRLHASTLKLLLNHSTEVDYKLIQQYLTEAAQSPFAQSKEKRRERWCIGRFLLKSSMIRKAFIQV